MNQPDFLIVGAARAGTTALYQTLKQHPEIYFPKIKEPCFYCFAGHQPDYLKGRFAFAITELDEYEKLFSDVPAEKRKGDASTPYLLLYDQTIANIKKYNASGELLKIIIILRDPVERAYSQYLWRVRDGREDLSFYTALIQEQERKKSGYGFDYWYAQRGLYYHQVKAYLDAFKNVHIILYDDYKMKPFAALSSVCDFLNIGNYSFNLLKDINRSGRPRFPVLTRLLTAEIPMKFKLLDKLPEGWKDQIKSHWHQLNVKNDNLEMDERAIGFLRDYYKTDMIKLEELIHTDLSSWKAHPKWL